jgi:hypothetical protein
MIELSWPAAGGATAHIAVGMAAAVVVRLATAVARASATNVFSVRDVRVAAAVVARRAKEELAVSWVRRAVAATWGPRALTGG